MSDNPFKKISFIEDKFLLQRMFDYFYELPWTSDTYIIHGKEVTPSRKTFMYGKDYSYSGIQKEAVPFDRQITYLARQIERRLNLEENYFNACLLNLYPDGDSSLSYHKDDEPEMDKFAPIVSFSLGATRKFYLKNDETKEVEKIVHNEGELLIMNYPTQEEWTHSIPKEKKVKEPRISLTFRRFLR